MLEILFATDFSSISEAAGQYAGRYTRRLGARLHLLHVLDPHERHLDTTHRLTDLARRIGVLGDATTAAVTGEVADEIVEYARRNSIDLIVVGSHGRTGFSRAVLGSVAERVARTAPCPVMTVPGWIQVPAAERLDALAPALGEEREGLVEMCVVCTQPSRDLICPDCRARLRGGAEIPRPTAVGRSTGTGKA